MTQQATESTLELGEDYLRDPYAVFARLRGERPVCKVTLFDGLQAWLITRYDDAKTALNDERFKLDMRGTDDLFASHQVRETDEIGSFGPERAAHLLNCDPPDHSRLRKLVTREFTARRIQRLRPRIEQIADELIDQMSGLTEIDLIDSFAFELPITVICELIGIPTEDRSKIREWTNIFVASRARKEIDAASFALAGYSFSLIQSKRAHPGDDLLSALVNMQEEGDSLSEHELVSMIFILMLAGHETTVNMIGNGMLSLLRAPEQADRLRADPSLIPSAVDEVLRTTPSLTTTTIRRTEEPVEIAGTTIPPDELVLVALGSANRDPERFENPNLLHIGNAPGHHLAFGHGIHYCLGAALAKLEGQIAFERLLTRLPRMRLAVPEDSLRWKPSMLIRGLERLPVRLH